MIRAVILRKDNHAAVPGLIKGKVDSNVIKKDKAFLIASVAAVRFCITTNLWDREGNVAFLLCFEDKKESFIFNPICPGEQGGGGAYLRMSVQIYV